jgi:hypothetical protein
VNRDDIIRMAREAGGGTTWWPLHTDTLERFAALVAENEREACAKAVEIFDKTFQTGGGIAGSIRARGEK